MATSSLLNFFQTSGSGCTEIDLSSATAMTDEGPQLEVDYDSNELTYLYQAIEAKAFMAAIDFMEDPNKRREVARQARTWVTRYEEDSTKVRWSQLPIHSAIMFHAPRRVIQLLIQHYPKGVRCTNDQQMLPLHLAIRRMEASNSASNQSCCLYIIYLLLREYPDAIYSTDHKGRVPLDFALELPAPTGEPGETTHCYELGQIINIYVQQARHKVVEMKHEEQLQLMKRSFKKKMEKFEGIEERNWALEEQVKESEAEIHDLKQQLQELQNKVLEQEKEVEQPKGEDTARNVVEEEQQQPTKKMSRLRCLFRGGSKKKNSSSETDNKENKKSKKKKRGKQKETEDAAAATLTDASVKEVTEEAVGDKEDSAPTVEIEIDNDAHPMDKYELSPKGADDENDVGDDKKALEEITNNKDVAPVVEVFKTASIQQAQSGSNNTEDTDPVVDLDPQLDSVGPEVELDPQLVTA